MGLAEFGFTPNRRAPFGTIILAIHYSQTLLCILYYFILDDNLPIISPFPRTSSPILCSPS
jgi:hypothetical protein